MADINIPGVTDKYKTNDLVKALVEAEKIPMMREQESLDTYKVEQTSWQRVNQYMSSLRESAQSLYSFNNPFSEKLTTSTQEFSVTAQAQRDADEGSFKIDVERIASSDRFLSENLDKDTTVDSGTYTYTVGEKSVTYNWKGGKLSDFVSGLNKRSNNIIKASLIGITSTDQALLIEAIPTGEENQLIFSEEALEFALKTNMVEKTPSDITTFVQNPQEISPIQDIKNHAIFVNNTVTLPPEAGFETSIPNKVLQDKNSVITFTIQGENVDDVTKTEEETSPVLPSPSSVNFKGITLYNEQLETNLLESTPIEKRDPVISNSYVFIKKNDGSIKKIDSFTIDEKKEITIKLQDYPDAQSIMIRNDNTGKEVTVSNFKAFNPSLSNGFAPINPISIAQDAQLKYEGISMSRSTNTIDDIVPNVTLTLEAPTEKTALITVSPDTENAKDELITFIGRYNQLIAEINILTQSNPELITELEYLSTEESDEAVERLGMFRSEFSLTSSKSTLQNIMSNPYNKNTNATVTMLSQIGISTNTSSGGSFSSSQLRGYLEIDEKTLDESLKTNMKEIKNLFGYDSDGDLITDTGIGYLLGQHLQAYVQTGGILALKNSSLDTKISSSQNKIDKLETQIAQKEQELNTKYGTMESTLNSLQSQSDTITNFSNQNNNNN